MVTDLGDRSAELPKAGQDWTWLPSADVAVRRERVRSMTVERLDGAFKGGYKCMWLVRVTIEGEADPVVLRPRFFHPADLSDWVDAVFPGAVFGALPPAVLREAP